MPLASAIVAMSVLRFVVAANTALTDDEAYYRLWALAPAMSYLDHPPMTGWMIAVGKWIGGDNPLGIRLAAPLTSLVGPFLLWRTAAILFDRNIAQCATWLVVAMPLLAVGGVIITPDTPSVLFWVSAAWAFAELHISGNAYWWLVMGLFAGLGLLSKYTNLFVVAGISLWIVLLPTNWRWLRCWQFWLGGVLALALVLPVVLWNYNHEWASFAKQFGRVVPHEAATPRYLLEFAGTYLGLASPLIAILSVVGLWRAIRAAVDERSQSSAMLATTVAPLLAYLLLHAVHDRAQPNWAAPVYPGLAICAAIALSAVANTAYTQLLGGMSLVVGFLLCGILYVHAINPIVRSPDIKDPTSQMRGWSEFATEVERLRLLHGARWIATSSYATTGQLAFQLKFGPQIVQLTERLRYAHLPPVDVAVLRSPGIYVELERRQMPEFLQERFSSVVPLGKLSRTYRGTNIATYVLYRVADPIGRVLRHSSMREHPPEMASGSPRASGEN
jgi:4-amino-4-deoxy-L-arabinose transferase-like glycosyltransferase